MNQPAIISLIIPAYNEEDAVGTTLRRSVDAFKGDLSTYGIEKIEIVLVCDGSKDQTLPRALEVPGIRVVSYDKNRGYGKAIESGYAAAKGNYIAFMDSDGTCDPSFLFALWKHMQQSNADVVLGCRMHSNSKMPHIRRFGNTLYAWLLSAISGQMIRDTASGMRLLRRDLLPRILPLPAGLHYTPAMSARCVLDPGVIISEIDMPYEERTGESKLNVVRDGLIFLQTILVTALFYTPLRIFGIIGIVGALLTLFLPPVHTAEIALLTRSLPWLILCGGLGLLFHFFSKRILPTWPSGPFEQLLDRAANPVILISVAAASGSASIIAAPWRPVWLPMLLTLSVTMLFLTAGRFILRQMNIWHDRELPIEELLKDTNIIDT